MATPWKPNNPLSGDPASSPISDNTGGSSSSGGTTGGGDLVSMFNSTLQDLPFYNTPAFQSIIQGFASDPNRTISNQQNANQWKQLFSTWGSYFSSQFQDKVGRQPTSDEYNTFLNEVVVPAQVWDKTPDALQVQQGATSTISNDFSSTVAQAAQDKATQQATAATATGSPFDQWQQAYTSSLNDVESSLKDYQSRLFEKLRPNLLTSLQAQGLLDTGGLNEAFAGAAQNLADTGTNYMAGLRSQAAQDIANKKFAIQSAPTNFALQNTFSIPGNLTQSGQTALQNSWADLLQQQQLQAQQNMFDQEMANQPSYLSEIGGQILGGIGSGLAQRKW